MSFIIRLIHLFPFYIAGVLTLASTAQNLDEMTLEDLLDVKTTVASNKASTVREQPGVITVITKQQIENMGARDLIDVLRLIPGLNFGVDVQGAVGLSIRGLWAHEGKFSLIVDGIEMNEILYSTTQFGGHYPVDHIQKVEVIRGPGSVIYGGYSELAVVRVTTEKGADINGVQFMGKYGQMDDADGVRQFSAQYGQKFNNLDVSIATFLGETRRGEGTYVGYYEDGGTPVFPTETYDFKTGSGIDAKWVNVGVSDDKLDFRFIYDKYDQKTPELFGFGGTDGDGLMMFFETLAGSLKYDVKINDQLVVTPYFSYSRQKPWTLTDDRGIADELYFDELAERIKGGLKLSYEISEKASVFFGSEWFLDRSKIVNSRDSAGDPSTYLNGKRELNYTNQAYYIEGAFDLNFAQLTAGGRFDDNSGSDDKVVPRIALTKAEEKWHAKLLYAQAFRTPGIFNLETNPDIISENTTSYELELGYKTSSKSYLTANFFYQFIKDPIVYDVAGGELYNNFERTGSKGVELEYRHKEDWGYANVSYSYYQADGNKVGEYSVITDDKVLLGNPQHKGIIEGSIKLGLPNLTLNPHFVYLSERWAWEIEADTDEKVQRKLPVTFFTNLFIRYQNLGLEGLDLGLGVYNLFNNRFYFIQPYDGDHSPIPGPTREFVARIDYAFGF